MKHVNGAPTCPSCEEKLKEAHPDIAKWFREDVKLKHGDAHISWSFRDKDNQEAAFLDGKSKLHFPLSAHNKSDDQGNACSLALDLFELDYNGQACWSWAYFRTIADEAAASNAPIFWGGHWQKLGDSDHFELSKQCSS